jgi:hypothetical protein
MNRTLIRLRQAFTFRVDYRLSVWLSSKPTARAWLIAAAGTNAAAQLLVAADGAFLANTLFGLMLPALLWRMAPRLSAGAGTVLVAQSVGSLVVILLGHLLGLPVALIEVAAWVWAIYSSLVLGALALKYLRTPKTQMPA